MPEPTAERAYLFRHALMRSAAYELQMPAQRASLHAFAAHALEDLHHAGVLAASVDLFTELADHCHAAAPVQPELRRRGLDYLLAAASRLEGKYQHRNEAAVNLRILDHPDATACVAADAARRAASATAIAHGYESAEELYLVATARASECADSRLSGRIAADHASNLSLLGRNHDAAACADRAAAESPDPATLANLLTVKARSIGGLGRTDEAKGLFRQAARLARDAASALDEGIALANLASLEFKSNEPELAYRNYRAAAELLEACGAKLQLCHTLGNLGSTYKRLGDRARARELYSQAARIARDCGSQEGEGFWTGCLALMDSVDGDLDSARPGLERARHCALEVGQKSDVALWTTALGDLYFRAGDTTRAREWYQRGTDLLRQVGPPSQLAQALHSLATLMANDGEPVRAREVLTEAIELARACQDVRAEGACLCQLGLLDLPVSVDLANRNFTAGWLLLTRIGDVAHRAQLRRDHEAPLRQAGLCILDDGTIGPVTPKIV
ncbi:MAG: tetratricopeptide repeat protein [Planctomycetes bacterium]|nr:tetratricopeptide repeat protein [Planctomycetota bacterium]MCW8135221.1 tetratricopeptide repeat protein [Planctomycetota bacterium]